MKNFTNSFKQFTSRLSARWLIMALMMLVGTSSAWADKTLYLNAGPWNDETSAWFEAWAWKNGSKGAWYSVTHISEDYYKFTVPDNVDRIKLLRKGPSHKSNAWESWNETGDISTESGKELFTITGWSYGNWSAIAKSYKLHGEFNNWTDVDFPADINITTLKTYKYKVKCIVKSGNTTIDEEWYGNTGTMTRNSCTDWTMTLGATDCQITADVNGVYNFTFDSSTKKVSVTYPTPTYTITYKDQGGANFSGIHANGYPTTHTYGTATTLKTASKTGYTFGGWFTTSACTGDAVTSLGATAYSANITLYAKWTANQYTITYNANGGSGAPNAQTKTYNVALTLSSTVPTRTGYTFQNWNTKANGSGSSYAKGGTYTANEAATLYAQWTANQYTITYKDQGNGAFSGTHASGHPTTHTYGTATTLKTASKAGYTFEGWFTDPACTGSAVTSLGATAYSADITLYAKWTEEAGVKIAALGSTALYTNDPTHFIPMYVSNEDLAGVGATSVKNYTWQFSDNGTSGWTNCTRSYSNFNAANNQSNGNVVVTNGSKNCNNWRANQVGYYRCKLTYNNGEEQVSGNIQVTGTNNNNTNKQHIGITYNLPIISVNTGTTDFPSDCFTSSYPSAHADDLKKKRSVDVMMFNPDGTICYDRKARMNYRGSSSLNFQKKSYAFCPGKEKCGDDEKGADYVKTNKENLFGLSNGAADKDWVLYAATPDPSMMRNRLVFDLYQKMRNLGVGQDETKEWGVNSMYVELVVNGEYKGVYVLMDKITNNANRVNIKNENGFIVKFDKTDVVDRVENTDGDQKTFATSRTGTKNSSNGIESYGSYIDQRFEIEYPEKEDIELWDAFYGNVQQRFENFETALENKDYATVRTLIDYDSWADWFIITELAKNQDGFRASCIFVYDGDKIEARPLWDQELSFNNGTRVKHGIDDPEGLLITTSSVYSDAFYAPFWFTGNKGTSVTGGLLNDPCFVSLVKQKWATYQSGVCSAASIGDMVADYNTELGNAINREAARWPYTQAARGNTSCGEGNYSYVGYYSDGEGNPNQYSYTASKAAITAWASDRSTALNANSGLGKAINDLNGEALIFTISPSSVETTPWKQVLLTVNAPEGYEYTFDDSSINNATVRASVKKDNNTYAIKIPRPTAWGIGGNGDPATQTQYQVSATIEVSGENECGTIQNGTATSTITLTDVTEDCNPEIVKP